MLKNLTKKFEQLFEDPHAHKQHSLALEEIKKKFTPSDDNKQIENLSYVFSHAVGKKEIPLLFSQLSSFFEMGFLFEKSYSGKYHAMQMFAYSYQMKKLDSLPLIQLPQSDLYKVLQTNAKNFLTKLQLSDYDQDERLAAFLIRISKTETLVLLSRLADPWAKVRLESLQNALMKIHFE